MAKIGKSHELICSARCHTPLGELILYQRGEALILTGRPDDDFRPDAQERETPLLRECKAQLAAYFAGTLRRFTIPLNPEGPAFHQKVWRTMIREIPYGQTRTYGEVALLAGHPRAARAVGTANRCCPIAILIPCHRVIAAGGKLGGYGRTPDIKRFLLALEAGHAPSKLIELREKMNSE